MMPDHGTRRRYGRGCRCTPCRGANATYDRELRARAGLREHGNRTTYTYGCRCEPCRQANRDYTRERMSRTEPTARILAKLEDLEWLLVNGEDPERAASRVGWSFKLAQRTLSQHRPDLLDLFRIASVA